MESDASYILDKKLRMVTFTQLDVKIYQRVLREEVFAAYAGCAAY